MRRSSPHRGWGWCSPAPTSLRWRRACSTIPSLRNRWANRQCAAPRRSAEPWRRPYRWSSRSWTAMRAPDFWTRTDFVSQFAVTLLTPFGWLYGASVAYRASHSNPYQAACKVLCVGNLTAGGTGKTPIAIAIAKALLARGTKPVFLTRGYGGQVRGPAFVTADDRATHVGDEPLLLASVAPVIVAADRAAGAKLAEENGFDIIIMDDGLQNFSLRKDLSVIVVDAEAGFGNSRILPAGPLREPARQGLQRAQAVILSGDGAPPALPGFAGPLLRVDLVQRGGTVSRGTR